MITVTKLCYGVSRPACQVAGRRTMDKESDREQRIGRRVKKQQRNLNFSPDKNYLSRKISIVVFKSAEHESLAKL